MIYSSNSKPARLSPYSDQATRWISKVSGLASRREKDTNLFSKTQTGAETHPDTYSMGAGGCFPRSYRI